jgi:hypothetical protein
MAAMKDLYLRLDSIEDRLVSLEGRMHRLMLAQRSETEVLRGVAHELERWLTPADEDHAPSVAGALDAQERRHAGRRLRALADELRGGQ